MSPHLNREQHQQLMALLREYRETMNMDPGRTSLAEQSIDTGSASPVRHPPYRVPYAYKDAMEQELSGMLEAGIVEPSSSEWAAPIVLVKKKDGTLCFCVDYQRLNAVSCPLYPMPRIDELLDRFGKAKFLTTLDLARGYWQVPMSWSSKEKTAFITLQGLFQFTAMPFGLQGAPATFQRMMNQLLRGMGDYAAAYLDDLIVFTTSWEGHLQHLRSVLWRLQEAGLTAKPSQCQFAMQQCVYLGHTMGGGQVRPETSKIAAVSEWKVAQTKKLFRAFLGLTGYYRKFISGYATIAVPLTDLTKKFAPQRVQWTEACGEAFQKQKLALCTKPILYCPTMDKQFTVQTDALDQGVGAVLSQQGDDGEEHPIAYFSRKLLPREEKYATVEKGVYLLS